MSWRLEWSVPAERSLLKIHWREGSRVDAAVMRFAESGEGDVFRLHTDDPITVRLRVRPCGVRPTYDHYERRAYSVERVQAPVLTRARALISAAP